MTADELVTEAGTEAYGDADDLFTPESIAVVGRGVLNCIMADLDYDAMPTSQTAIAARMMALLVYHAERKADAAVVQAIGARDRSER